TADRNRSHWSTSKTPSYTKSVSWQHHRIIRDFSNSDSGGPNRRTATADNKSMFNGKKINRIH
ncbi:hypothetical protein ACV2CT_09525, partial [Escherichia coli]